MSISTNQAAVQVYTCDALPPIPIKSTQPGLRHESESGHYDRRKGCVVIEQQDWIDGIHHPEWHRDQVYGPQREYVWVAEHKLRAK